MAEQSFLLLGCFLFFVLINAYNIDANNNSSGAGAGAGAVKKSWGRYVVARTDVPVETVQHYLDYACNQIEVDCKPVQPGGVCFEPDTVLGHASFAFDYLYQARGIYYARAAVETNENPSYGNCVYP